LSAPAVVESPGRGRDAATAGAWGLPWPVWALAAAVFLVEMAFGPRYGLFRDEFYYLACADHLAWGYVDHPPLSVAVLAAVKAALGDSILAVRLVPALLGATLVLLAGRLARAMGGSGWARVLAAVSVAVVPQYLAQASYWSMNAFDLVFWSAAALLVAGLRPDEPQTRRFVALGVVLGLGLLNKISVLFFGAGLAVALLALPLRRQFLRPGPWIAAALAGLLFLPHVLWQAANGWPTREFIENATRYKNVALGPAEFLMSQVPELHPLNAPLWIAGLAWLLFSRRGRPYRALGIVWVVAFAVMAVQHSKPYYLGPAYPPLLAAGAVVLEGARWRRARPAVAAVLLATGAALAPLAIPVLPVETFIAYQNALGAAPSPSERNELGLLPQFFADRFGWAEMTAAVASVYEALPPEEKARAVIVTSNYGEAGALRYHGRAYGLPPAVSQHNSFWFWGPGRADVDVAIVVGMDPESLRDAWTSVEEAARVASPYAMPYERRWPVLVCRGLKLPVEEAWRKGRHFI
jgi:hypothetical protein